MNFARSACSGAPGDLAHAILYELLPPGFDPARQQRTGVSKKCAVIRTITLGPRIYIYANTLCPKVLSMVVSKLIRENPRACGAGLALYLILRMTPSKG